MSIQDDKEINKKPLYVIGLLLLLSYLVIMSFAYQQMKSDAVDEQFSDLKQHLLFQDALRSYVNEELKPVFYRLQDQDILSPDFFDPHVLSGTFIARNVYQRYHSRIIDAKLPRWEYRISAKTPRNPVNQATPEELELLESFNKDRNLTEVVRVELDHKKPFIYYATPIQATNLKCLRCHGDPSTAPQDLVKLYGSVNAFNAQLGDIRAFVSYRFDLTSSLERVKQTFMTISLLILALILGFYILGSRIYILEQKRKREILEQQKQLDHIAHHDFLTQLSNRHKLSNDLTQRLTELNQSKPVSSNIWIMMLDIDFFKAINDDFGHDIGDITLQTIGKLLQDEVHKLKEAEAYRLGGEEFLLVIPNTNENKVCAIYETICNTLAATDIEGLDRVVQLSAGATHVKQEEHQYDILKRVDNALYQAKEQGRAQIVIA